MGENIFQIEDIERLMDAFDNSNITEFEIEQDGFKFALKKERIQMIGQPSASVETTVINQPQTINSESTKPLGYILTAPIIGTFFESAEPNAKPFVTVGQRVEKGDVLCIIESMKLMNEIVSEQSGIVSDIFVKNGDPVEYGQEIMLIK